MYQEALEEASIPSRGSRHGLIETGYVTQELRNIPVASGLSYESNVSVGTQNGLREGCTGVALGWNSRTGRAH